MVLSLTDQEVAQDRVIWSASVGDVVTVMATAMVSGVWRRHREFPAREQYLRFVGRKSAPVWGPQPPGGHVERRVP